MTQTARDERDIAPYDWTLAGGPEGPALAIDTPPDPGLDQSGQGVTYDTREPDGFGPDDYRWQPITDPAEIATIEGALAQGIDPPYYEVWVDQAPAALGPGDLAPAEEGPTVYAWEQTGPAVGEGQLYEVTDPVVIAAYEEAHPAQGAVDIANPADYDEAAAVPSQEPAPSADLDRDLTPALDL